MSRIHDGVIKWKHFPRYWPFVRGIHRHPLNSPHKGQWRGALMFSLICARINGWVNTGEAGDLRRQRTHYNVIVIRHNPAAVMQWLWCFTINKSMWRCIKYSSQWWNSFIGCATRDGVSLLFKYRMFTPMVSIQKLIFSGSSLSPFIKTLVWHRISPHLHILQVSSTFRDVNDLICTFTFSNLKMVPNVVINVRSFSNRQSVALPLTQFAILSSDRT